MATPDDKEWAGCTDTFRRHRRALILITFAILVMHTVGAENPANMNVLGLNVSIERPERVSWAIWAFLIYSVAGYVDYWRRCRQDEWGDELNREQARYATEAAKKIALKKGLVEKGAETEYEAQPYTAKTWHVNINRRRYTVEGDTAGADVETVLDHITAVTVTPANIGSWRRVKAACKTLFFSPFFLNTLLPTLLTMLAVVTLFVD